MAMSGQDPQRYLRERDPFIRSLMLRIASRHQELQQLRDDDLATKIIVKLGEALKKK